MRYKTFLMFLIILLLLGIVLGRPNNFRITHSVQVNNSQNQIRNLIGNFENWPQWILWDEYPSPALELESSNLARIKNKATTRFTLYLNANKESYTLSFSSEPIALSGYCQFSVTGNLPLQMLTMNCSGTYKQMENGLWEKVFPHRPKLPINLKGSLERLRLKAQSLRD